MTGEPGAHREYLRPLLSYAPLVYIEACASRGQRSLLLLLRDRGVGLNWWRAQALLGCTLLQPAGQPQDSGSG